MEYLRAKAGDAAAMTALRLEFLAAMHPLEPALRDTVEKSLPPFFTRHLDRDVLVYLAKEAGEAVSMVLLQLEERPAGPRFPTGRTGVLLNVYTKPAFRGRGCAMTLLRMALTDAEAAGLDLVELKATRMGEPLYRKLGFGEARSSDLPMSFRFSR